MVRGADLVDSTPRQLLLYRLLCLPAPRYAHVPLVLGPDGRRLAKRHGAVTLADRRALGERPEEVLAWMASSLGLNEIGGRSTPADLLARFDPARLQRERPSLSRSRYVSKAPGGGVAGLGLEDNTRYARIRRG